MSYRIIKPKLNGKQAHLMGKPSMFRACASGNKDEYDCCDKKIMELYRIANNIKD